MLRERHYSLGLSLGVQDRPRVPPSGYAALSMDFVPDSADTDWQNLSLNFVNPEYYYNAADPSVPTGTFIRIQLWR